MKRANIFENIIYNGQKPQITVLFETDFTKEIRIALQAGAGMKSHKTAFPIVIAIIEGGIRLGVPQGTLTMDKGDMIALESEVPHDLTAEKDTIIRLTLTKYDTADRVKSLAN